MQAWLERIWYGRGSGGALLVPLSWLFAAGAALRRSLYRWRWLTSLRVQAPVVVVGNVTVGGNGKTPLVAWLAGQLQAQGLRVGIVSRGYGGSASRPQLVTADDLATQVGDEPLLLAQRGWQIAIGADRVAAARLLGERDVIIADDGLQHYRLARTVEIAVVDGERGLGNGRLLPAGPLREPRQRLQQVDATVQHGGSASTGDAMLMHLAVTAVINLQTRERRTLADWTGQRVHAVAGIGHPQRFFGLLRAAGIELIEHPLADHAQLAASEIQFADGLPVLMTEKDAVKYRGLGDYRHWYVEVAACFEPAHAARLLELVQVRLRSGESFGVQRG